MEKENTISTPQPKECTVEELATICRDVLEGPETFRGPLVVREDGCIRHQENLNVMRIENPTGTAVLVGWPLNGDFTRALVIPSDEFYNDEEEELPRVLEALEYSLSEL